MSSDLKDIQKQASEILEKQSDKAHQKLPEHASSRLQVEFIPSEEKKLVPRAQKEIFEKISVWDTASLEVKQALVLAWLIQNESYLNIKNFTKTIEMEQNSLPYKNLIKIIDEFVQATDAKIGSTTNINNNLKTRFFKPDTEINFILNKVAKELGYSV